MLYTSRYTLHDIHLLMTKIITLQQLLLNQLLSLMNVHDWVCELFLSLSLICGTFLSNCSRENRPLSGWLGSLMILRASGKAEKGDTGLREELCRTSLLKNGASVSAPLWLWLACQTLLQRSPSPVTRLGRLRRDWRARP